MAQFTYKARRRSGEVVTGVLDVADRGAALLQSKSSACPDDGRDAQGSSRHCRRAAAEHPAAWFDPLIPPGVASTLNWKARHRLLDDDDAGLLSEMAGFGKFDGLLLIRSFLTLKVLFRRDKRFLVKLAGDRS